MKGWGKLKDKYKIALAGLLHDIGKFCARAGKKYTEDRKEFEYPHACYTYGWIKEHKNLFSKSFSGLNVEDFAKLSAKHHKPKTYEEKLIQIADWFSSAEREKKFKDELNYLHSVFESVSFTQKGREGFRYISYYRLKTLELEKESIFPVNVEGYVEDGEIKRLNELEKALGSYRRLYEEFEEDLKKIEDFKEEKAFNFIYYLMQKYLWCVPASTFDLQNKSRHYPDISLFDHSRVLAAIAVSLYDYINWKGIPPEFEKVKEENSFLLVEGDISGIQKFIYNVAKTEGIEDFSVAKALRGRSFIISMLPEVLARYILKEFEYPITNALYIGGGKFQLLLGNTDNIRSRLEEIEREINAYFFEEFHAQLGIVISKEEFSGKYLLGEDNLSYADIVERLQKNIDVKKKKKFSAFLTKEFNEKGESLCLSCKSLPAKEKELCYWCSKSNEIGSIIPKAEYIAFGCKDDGDNDEKPNEVIFGKFGKVLITDKAEDLENCSEVLILNKTEFLNNNGFKFIGNTVPLVNEENKNLLKQIVEEDEELKVVLKEKSVIPFKILGALAEGDKKLAYFRADVDNLGLIFSEGLKEEDEKSRYTISRIATLSRMLDLFFSGYINTLARRFNHKEVPVDTLIYIVYSGGDDLFVIAPHDKILEFAQTLREELEEYTARNREFGLSGGIYIANPTASLNFCADQVGSLEEQSKKTYFKVDDRITIKDSITILGKTFPWFEGAGRSSLTEILTENDLKVLDYKYYGEPVYLEDIKSLVDKIVELFREEENKLSRRVLYRLLEYHRTYVKNGKIKAEIYPKLYYLIERNLKNDVRKFFEDTLLIKGYKKLKATDVIKNLDVVIQLVLIRTREVKYATVEEQ